MFFHLNSEHNCSILRVSELEALSKNSLNPIRVLAEKLGTRLVYTTFLNPRGPVPTDSGTAFYPSSTKNVTVSRSKTRL